MRQLLLMLTDLACVCGVAYLIAGVWALVIVMAAIVVICVVVLYCFFASLVENTDEKTSSIKNYNHLDIPERFFQTDFLSAVN